MNFVAQLLGISPLSEEEHQLAKLEQSWADCAHGFSSGDRFKRTEENISIRCSSLIEIHSELEEVHRKNFMAGDSSALIWALRLCLNENLPVPYWCTEEILKRIEKVCTEPCSLHDLFGLTRTLPATGKKAKNIRAREEQALILYARVWQMKAADKSISKEAAIQATRREHFLFISQRTARALFDSKEAEQAKFRKALRINFTGKF